MKYVWQTVLNLHDLLCLAPSFFLQTFFLSVGFHDLSQDDQLILIKAGFFEIWLTRHTRMFNLGDKTLTFGDGNILPNSQLEIVYTVSIKWWSTVLLVLFAILSPGTISSAKYCNITNYGIFCHIFWRLNLYHFMYCLTACNIQLLINQSSSGNTVDHVANHRWWISNRLITKCNGLKLFAHIYVVWYVFSLSWQKQCLTLHTASTSCVWMIRKWAYLQGLS